VAEIRTTGHRRRQRPWRGVVMCLAIGLAVTGCRSSDQVHVDQPGTASPSGSATASTTPTPTPTPTVEQQVLAQYRAFWPAQTTASLADEASREAVLSPYTADPELRSLLDGIAAQRRSGHVFYGADIPRPEVEMLSVDRGTAVVRDCADSSQTGLMDAATGEKLTKGVERNPVVTTMHRGDDGVWRVTFLTHPQASC
jgi:hypothetical protein